MPLIQGIDGLALKRTSSEADLLARPLQKKARSEHLPKSQETEFAIKFARDGTFQDHEIAERILSRSISLACEAVGFEAIRMDALESFRQVTAAYMHDFLIAVRQSMTSCRRSRIIPHDLLHSLHVHQLSLRALLPHLDPPVTSTRSRLALTVLLPSAEENSARRASKNMFTTSPSVSRHRSYIPQHFPRLPDAHTFQCTPDLAQREEDPQRIRELIVEEGRLAESALRRLVNSATEQGSTNEDEKEGTPTTTQAKRHQTWKKAILTAAAPDFALTHSTAICLDPQDSKASRLASWNAQGSMNAEKRYWRIPVR